MSERKKLGSGWMRFLKAVSARPFGLREAVAVVLAVVLVMQPVYLAPAWGCGGPGPDPPDPPPPPNDEGDQDDDGCGPLPPPLPPPPLPPPPPPPPDGGPDDLPVGAPVGVVIPRPGPPGPGGGSGGGCGDDECQGESSSSGGSDDPVLYGSGAAVEKARDLYLPGAPFGWGHSRSYSSRLKNAAGTTPYPGMQGQRWTANLFTALAKKVGSGQTHEVHVYPDATHKRVFKTTDGGSTFTGPADYHATLSHSGQLYKLTFPGSRQIWEFHDDTVAERQRGLIYRKLRNSSGSTLEQVHSYSGSAINNGGRILATQVKHDGATTVNSVFYYYGYDEALPHNYGKIVALEVRKGTTTAMMGSVYVYWKDTSVHSSDCGNSGDLILVHTLEGLAASLKIAGASGNDKDSLGGSFTADQYNDCWIVIIDGNNAGHIRKVDDTTTTEIQWTPDLPFNITAGDRYFIVNPDGQIKTTHYRYYRSGDSEGGANQLKMVLEPEAVENLVATHSSVNSPGDILGKDDNDDLGNESETDTVQEYASRSFTYYKTNELTNGEDPNHVKTPWNGDSTENLESKYGGSNTDETEFVKTETIHASCAGCGGGGASGGVKRSYFYMDLNGGPDDSETDFNEVCRIAVEDTEDSSGTFVRRRIVGLNNDMVIVRDVTAIGNISSPTFWCRSMKVVDSGSNGYKQAAERRMPSAHTCVGTDSEVAEFLDPTGTTEEQSNDARTLNASSGVIHTYAYSADHYRTATKIKKGSGGTEYYLSATDYGDGTNDPVHLPKTVYTYPDEQSSKTGGTEVSTTYTYWYHTDTWNIKVRKTTYTAVTAAKNGSGTATSTYEYYDEYGRLRWAKDGEGHVTYHAYDTDTGRLAYIVTDIDTDENDRPAYVNNPPSEWTAWSDGAPNNGSNYDFQSSTGLNLETKLWSDDYGRATKAEDAEGMVTYTVYLDNETRVYPAWDSETKKPKLPVQVTETDDGDRAIRSWTFDPTNVAIGESGGVPTGSDGTNEIVPLSAYTSFTRYNYNYKGQLESVDRFHDIPTSGDYTASNFGTLSNDYHRSFFKYDDMGRRTHGIRVVSGTATDSSVEQVMKTVYDDLDRVKEVHLGVSATGHDMGSSYATDPTLKKVSATFYDESTPGSGTSGVGDGLVTSTIRYYDASNESNNVQMIYHHNWRGQLRGIEPEAAPYTVQDADNIGRVVATAAYTSEPTWSTVVGDGDYAATVATNRGTLSKTHYDQMGRAYATEVYSIAGDGSAGDKIRTDSYYDRDSRVVATYSPGQGGVEFAYDGAGRLTEARAVTELESTKYSSGVFQYRDPQPGAATGGDDKVVQIVRRTYDKVGRVTEAITMEANHDDPNGLDVENHDDYVQTAVYSWYDDAHRLTDRANYGTCDAEGKWEYSSLTTRPSSAPARSDTILVTSYSYSGAGRLLDVTDPKNIETKNTYDDLGRTVKVEEDESGNDERTTLMEYDGLSNVVKRIADTDNDDTTFDNGDWTTDADDQITTYSFGDSYYASLVTKIKYPDGDDTDDNVQFEYDLDGQVNKRKLQKLSGQANRPEIAFGYDATFRRPTEQHVTANGVDTTIQSIKRTYDNLGRLEKVTSYSSSDCTGTPVNEVKYTYNGLGALDREYQEHEGAVDSNTLYVQYAYDDTDSSPDDGVYDKGMRPKSLRYPNVGDNHYTRTAGEVAARQVYSLYTDSGGSSGVGDALSRVTAVASASTRGGGDANVYAAYSYNGVRRMVVEDFVQPDVRLDYWGQTADTYAGFDRFGRVIQQLWRDYGAPADRDKYSYGHDRNSSRLYRENNVTGDKDELYHYDNLNRLTAFERGNLDAEKDEIPTAGGDRVRGQAWGLSATGNWNDYQIDANGDGDYGDAGDLDQDRTHNAVNETTGITETQGTAWADPAWSARGNMTTVPKPTSLANTYTCAYDAWNRLVEVKSGATVVGKYEYDGLNRRVKKHIDTHAPEDPDGVDTYRHFYYNNAWQIVETRKSSTENTEPETLQPEYQYVWSVRYVDAAVLRDENTDADDTCDDERLYYLTDANMNVTCLTDTAGDAVERYVYDPYGEVTILDGTTGGQTDWATDADQKSDVANAILYCGYYRDAETGLYQVRNRFYHPPLGRWLQRDPIQYADGMSLYEYVGGDPAGRRDSTGLQYGIYCDPWRPTCERRWKKLGDPKGRKVDGGPCQQKWVAQERWTRECVLACPPELIVWQWTQNQWRNTGQTTTTRGVWDDNKPPRPPPLSPPWVWLIYFARCAAAKWTCNAPYPDEYIRLP